MTGHDDQEPPIGNPPENGSLESLDSQVVGALREGCQVISPEFRYLQVNNVVCLQARSRREDLIGRRMIECFPGIDSTPMFEVLRRCMTGRHYERMENEFHHADGSRSWFELQFLPVSSGVCILSRDITESRLRLGALVDASPDAVIGRSIEGIVTSWNATAARMFGYEANDVVGKQASLLFVVDGGNGKETDRAAEVVAGEHIGQYDVVGRCKDSTQLDLAVSLAPIQDGTGRCTGMTIIARDTTRLKQTERLFRDLLEFSPDAIVVSDAAGTIRLVNSRAEQLFDATRDQLLGMPAAMVIVERRREEYRARLSAVADASPSAAQNEQHTRDAVCLRVTGGEFPADVVLARIDAPDGVMVTAAIRDVTERHERKRLQAMFRLVQTANQRLDPDSILRVALENAREVVGCTLAAVLWWENGPGGSFRVGGVNHAAADLAALAGLSPSARISGNDTSLISLINLPGPLWTDNLAAIEHPVEQRMVAAGLRAWCVAPLITESRLLGALVVADGHEHQFDAADASRLAQFAEAVAVSIRNAMLFEELQTAYARLGEAHRIAAEQERFRVLGQMASGIAHDLNNALSPVVALTELMTSGLASPERVPRYLESMRVAALDSQQIIARLREFYHPLDPAAQALEINRIVSTAVGMTAPRWKSTPDARGAGIRVELDLADGLPLASGSESELRQALVNLIINAADAMDHGGTLTISTRLVTEPDDMIEIQVSDTGTGMDADTQSRVFEPYFTTKHGKGGTGLGLSSVWGVVQRHGGTILVASESGLGTTFTIRLPAAPDADATEESRSTMAPGPARQLRVLCVDDDPRLRSLVEEMLTLLGHAVTVAGGGDEARQLFDPTLHDLVITDLGMPDVNGQAVAEHVKRTSPPTPVILLTGWGQQILDTDRKPHCVDVVLAKPPSMDKLSSTLARVSRGQVQP